ncbi:MAG: hypothetical protein ACHQHN_04445 [Sphingobacteriales bacterium]
MNTTEELTGTLVLVHPDLKNDPGRKWGEIGVVTGADLRNDNIYVGFGRNGQGAYGSDALLIMKPPAAIYKQLEEQKATLNTNDYKALFQIALMLEYQQSSTNVKNAIGLALRSDTVRNMSMVSVEDALGLKREQMVER